jgi:hypothetical protein
MVEIKKDAILDDNQKEVISRIAVICGDNRLTVTRGHSMPQEQLDLIERFGKDHGCIFPEFIPDGPVDLKKECAEVGLVYHWQRTWSRLLHLGVVVNPPLSAICLDDYTRPSGEKMKGKVIHKSAHIAGQVNGCWPIDFSARVNGQVNFDLVRDIMDQARISNAGIQDIRVEHGNGCVHIDTLKVI